MAEFKPREPDFRGDGVAVWVAKDKNGNNYLTIKLLNSLSVKAFKNIPKPTTAQQAPKTLKESAITQDDLV